MARSSKVSSILGIVAGYEVAAFLWNWYQTNQSAASQTAALLLPFDGIGWAIGYPGTGVTGNLTGGAAPVSGYQVTRGY
jgi:hypothetical protein